MCRRSITLASLVFLASRKLRCVSLGLLNCIRRAEAMRQSRLRARAEGATQKKKHAERPGANSQETLNETGLHKDPLCTNKLEGSARGGAAAGLKRDSRFSGQGSGQRCGSVMAILARVLSLDLIGACGQSLSFCSPTENVAGASASALVQVR